MEWGVMYLADIGNSRFHLYDGKEVLHLGIDEALQKYANHRLYYISVNSRYEYSPHWIDLAPYIKLPFNTFEYATIIATNLAVVYLPIEFRYITNAYNATNKR